LTISPFFLYYSEKWLRSFPAIFMRSKAGSTRDELQAVAAHELAHISRGDAFYVTLVCSLANFLEKIMAAMEPENSPPAGCASS
jgi:hypothetical protein